MKLRHIMIAGFFSTTLLGLAACGDTMGERALTGGAIGAGAGAALGAASGGSAATGAIIGGGVGAAAGAATTERHRDRYYRDRGCDPRYYDCRRY